MDIGVKKRNKNKQKKKKKETKRWKKRREVPREMQSVYLNFSSILYNLNTKMNVVPTNENNNWKQERTRCKILERRKILLFVITFVLLQWI